MNTIKRKYKITGMHCTSCAMTIDMDLEDLEGINSSNTSYAKQETEVEFDPDQVTDALVIEAIKKTGYEAQAC